MLNQRLHRRIIVGFNARCETHRGFQVVLSSLAVFALSTLLLGSLTPKAWSQESDSSEAEVSYYHDVRPIFQAACHGCHQPAKTEGGYDMTDFATMLKGGDSGFTAIQPGDLAASYLVELVTPIEGHAEMPVEGKPLDENKLKTIRSWIVAGATNDTPANAHTAIDQDHPPVYEGNPVITSIDFSGDGKWLAVAGYHEALLFDATTYRLTHRLIGLSERIESVVFSPDSSQLAVAGGSPGRKGELQIWNVADQSLLRSHSVGFDTLYGASWSGDGKLIAFGCPDNTVRAIDASSGEQVLFNGAHDDWVLDTVFSAQNDHLVSVSRDRSMKLIKVETQRFVDNITSITPGALKGGLNTIDRHPERDELLTGGADGVPKLYKMFREQARKIGDDFNLIRAFPELRGRVYDVRFSPDGKLVIAGSSYNGKGQIRIYQTEDAKPLLDIPINEGGVFSVAFSADSQAVAAAGFDGVVRIFDQDSGQMKTSLPLKAAINELLAE